MRRLAIYAICLSVAGGAVALGLDLLVETDQERIEKLIDNVRSAATAGDADRLVPLLDLDGDGFEISVGHDHERFASGDVEPLQDRLGDAVDWLHEARLHFDAPSVEIQGDRAHAWFHVDVQRDDGNDESIPVDLTLHRTGSGWHVARFRTLSSGAERAARR